MRNWKLLLVAGISMTILSGCAEATIEKVDKPASENVVEAAATKAPEKESEPEVKKPEIYNTGDSVKFDNLIITVNGIRESKGKFMTASEGNVLLLVDITAENTGDEEESVSSLMQTEMVDADGFSYNLTIAEDAKGSFDGSIGVGRKLRGEVAFEVPAESATLEFIFSDPFKSGQAIWKVK